MKLKMTLAVAALLTVGLSSAAAYADTLTFTLTNATGGVSVTGGSLTYDATVSAPAGNSGAKSAEAGFPNLDKAMTRRPPQPEVAVLRGALFPYRCKKISPKVLTHRV